MLNGGRPSELERTQRSLPPEPGFVVAHPGAVLGHLKPLVSRARSARREKLLEAVLDPPEFEVRLGGRGLYTTPTAPLTRPINPCLNVLRTISSLVIDESSPSLPETSQWPGPAPRRSWLPRLPRAR